MSEVVKMKNDDQFQNEEKHSKFRKLAEPRVTRALKAIHVIGNLSNRSTYEYSDDEIKTLVRALEGATEQMAARFAPAAKQKTGFSF
jgi:hypothetical protein